MSLKVKLIFLKIQNWLLAFVFLFTYFKMQGFWTNIGLLRVFLFEKHINHRLFSCFIVFHSKEFSNCF